MLVIFSFTRIEFDVTIVAAILTIVGYSINNTIVIFDRIRENIRLEGQVRSYKKLAKIENRSDLQYSNRRINTTVTTLVVVLDFLIHSEKEIEYFAINLMIDAVAVHY